MNEEYDTAMGINIHPARSRRIAAAKMDAARPQPRDTRGDLTVDTRLLKRFSGLREQSMLAERQA
jgi:hypothetical protein